MAIDSEKIAAMLRDIEKGSSVNSLCRQYEISKSTFYRWREKYQGMNAALIARFNSLETENSQLKKMYENERLKADLRAETLERLTRYQKQASF